MKKVSVPDPKYFQWVSVSSILFSWLLDSIKPDVVEYCRYEKTCKAILNKVNSIFLKKDDDSRIFELLLATTQSIQRSRKVKEYANELENLWTEKK